MTGASCEVELSAGYQAFCTSPVGADPNGGACQSVVNFVCANPPGALPANCTDPQDVPLKSESISLLIQGEALAVQGISQSAPKRSNGSGGGARAGFVAGTRVSLRAAPARAAVGASGSGPGVSAAAISLTSSVNPAVTGQRVRLTATVIPAPSGGVVRFLADGRTIPGCGAVAVNRATGTAECETTFATGGTRDITAVYSGSFSARSPALAQTVTWSVVLVRPPMGSGGVAESALRCAPHSGGCAVTISLEVSGRAAAALGASAGRPAVLGIETGSIPEGGARTFRTGLDPAARKLLGRMGSLSARERIALTIGGQRHTVAIIKVTLER